MENKLTAVEWIEQELGRRQSIIDSEPEGFLKQSMYANLYVDLFERAKEMEKEQIIYAFNDSRILSVANNCNSGNQYYNETFKK